jgi:hypothetical protein
MNALILISIFCSITLVKCSDRSPQQKANMNAQIAFLLNQMPKDTRVPISDRIKYVGHINNKLLKENEKKKLEKEKGLYEQLLLTQKAKNQPFVKNFFSNRW